MTKSKSRYCDLPLKMGCGERSSLPSALSVKRRWASSIDKKKSYQEIPIKEQVEVLSFAGNIVEKDGNPMLHAHAVVGKRDGTAHGGHFLNGRVWPTLEMIITEMPAHLRRLKDEETGLPLIDLSS